MEFAEAVKQKQKMCDGAKNCEGCSLSHFNNGFQLYCSAFIEKHPEEAEKVIMRWAEEHPH